MSNYYDGRQIEGQVEGVYKVSRVLIKGLLDEIVSLQSQLAEARERERQMREAVREYRCAVVAFDSCPPRAQQALDMADRYVRERNLVINLANELFPPEAT